MFSHVGETSSPVMASVWLPVVVVAYVLSTITSIGIVLKCCFHHKTKPDAKPEAPVRGTPTLTPQVAVLVILT